MIKKNIVFLSYGNETEYLRAIFCIYSLSAWVKNNINTIGIVIYTDNPVFFQTYLSGFAVEYSYLSPELLSDIRGNTGYIHHIKVATVDMTFERYPGEDLIFIDSDTFFYSDPAELFSEYDNHTSFMHKREYTLKDGLEQYKSFDQAEYPQAFIDYLSGRPLMIGGTEEMFTDLDYNWNSGVLGLRSDFSAYMPDIKRLTAAFFEHSKWFVSEQLAFSLILQRRTVIKPAEGFVYHYWGKRQKVLVDQLIKKLLEKNSESLKDKSFTRSLTKKWKTLINADLIREQIELAYAEGSYFYAARQTLKLLMTKIIG